MTRDRQETVEHFKGPATRAQVEIQASESCKCLGEKSYKGLAWHKVESMKQELEASKMFLVHILDEKNKNIQV